MNLNKRELKEDMIAQFHQALSEDKDFLKPLFQRLIQELLHTETAGLIASWGFES